MNQPVTCFAGVLNCLHAQLQRWVSCLAVALFLWPTVAPAGDQTVPLENPGHEMYIMVSMTRGFVIGGRIASPSGIYRSIDRVNLEHIGRNHPRTDTISFDPRDRSVFFTAGLNGSLRTMDGGRNWRIMTSWDMTEPKWVVVDPHNPDQVMLALPDGIGVSTDRGMTWKRFNEGITRRYTQVLAPDRGRPGQWLAGTELGIFLTQDYTKGWRKVLATDKTVNHIKQSPHRSRIFWAATQANGVWVSEDHGHSWNQISGIGTEHTLHNLDFDANNELNLAISTWGRGVLVSEDGGRTWTERNSGLPNPNVWRVAFDPDIPGRLYASCHEEAVYVSNDLGHSWNPLWFEGAIVWSFVFLPVDHP